MAKRYARINWQNYPSTATPRNAANLNKMDKGIDDLDNAIETLNDNLATYLIKANGYTNTLLDGFDINTLKSGFYIGANLVNAPAGVIWCSICCIMTNATLGSQELLVITSSGNALNGKLYVRTCPGTTWTGWVEK